MEPTRDRKTTINDLLDRILEKGVVLNLDLIIGLADIPLVAINLRAAIASVETMARYGIMNVLDGDLIRR
ncbi:MAG: gas vesicle protein [Firmicutes bacterium]|nr:gas vesicle protein [Bacillota bacterium]